MHQKPVRSLVEVLSELTDWRDSKGKRHSLHIVLSVVILGLFCQQNSLRQIAIWAAELDLATKSRLQFRHGKAPSYGTLLRVMRKVNLQELRQLLVAWVEEVVAAYYPTSELVAAAFDGKTLRHSADDAEGVPAVQMLNVMLHELGVMLTSQVVPPGTSEVPTARQVLEDLTLTGRIFTADAAHTKRPTVAGIVKKGGMFSCA